MLAWRITCLGITGIAIAEKRGRARYLVARSAVEIGYCSPVSVAFVNMTCRRAPGLDGAARAHGREGFIDEDTLTRNQGRRPTGYVVSSFDTTGERDDSEWRPTTGPPK